MHLTGNGKGATKSHRQAGLKQQFGALALGILVLATVFGFVAFVSNDARVAYAIGVILIFCCAWWVGTKSEGNWLGVVLLCGPLTIAFGFFALPQLPSLWPNLLLWGLVAVIGWRLPVTKGSYRTLVACGAGAVFAVSLWYCIHYLPDEVARSLNRFSDTSAPTFKFQPIGDEDAQLTAKPGKVLVIDFLATWCAPCIAELPEIVGARADLRDKSDIEFILVANDSGGDTPQGFKSFAQRRHVTLPLAYDAGGKAHSAFGLTGVPALVVLDRAGRVRLRREGYNAAETNFRRDLVQFLKTL